MKNLTMRFGARISVFVLLAVLCVLLSARFASSHGVLFAQSVPDDEHVASSTEATASSSPSDLPATEDSMLAASSTPAIVPTPTPAPLPVILPSQLQEASGSGILTPSGSVSADRLSVGDRVIGWDDETGSRVTNTVEKIEIITPKHYDYWEQDEEGTYTRLVEVPFAFYRINNQYELFKDQSVLANGRVVHASELHIGDTLTNSDGEHILIDSITETTARTSWVKLSVSGNHTYIEDGLVLHNASRYWVGGGSNANWSANANTNWGSASNTRDNASIPGASDDVFFDGVGFGNSPSTLSASISINSLDMTGYANTLTHNSSVILTIAGNTFKLSSGMTYALVSSSTPAVSFTSTTGTSGTPTMITTNGKFLGNTTFNGLGGYFTLLDNLSLSTTATLTHTAGTFDANNQNVTVGLFSSSNSNVRTITAGSGTWTITGNNTTVWTTSTATNLTLTTRPTLNFTYAGSVGTRTILTGALPESMAPNINITAGTDTVSVTTNIGDLNFTGFAGTLAANTRTVYGNLTLAPGMTINAGSNGTTLAATSGTKTITSNGLSWNLPLIINGVGGTFQLADDLTLDSARALTLTAGTFDANNKNVSVGLFSSSNANVRTLTPGSGTWNITGSGNIVWTTSTFTNLTLTTRPTLNFTYAGSVGTRTLTTGSLAEAFAPNVNITAGTDTVSVSANVGDLNFTGFAGTLGASSRIVYGNLTFSPGMTITSSGGATTMSATSGTKTFTSNGQAVNTPINFDGVGGTFELADDFNLVYPRAVSLLNGTLDLKGHNITGGFTLFVYGSTTLRLQGNETISFVGKAVEASSTVVYYGTSNYPNLAFGNRYGNLTFAGSGGNWTLDDSVNIAGNLNINSGSTLDVSTNNHRVSVAGDFANNGTFVSRLGTVVMNNAGNQTLHPGSATFRNLVINDGLVAQYKFDDVMGNLGSTVVDSSPFGNIGALSGTSAPQPSDNTPRVNFSNTKSLNFNGTNYVDTGDDVSMKIPLPISWCTWVYITDPSANNILIKGEFNDTQYYGITTYINTTGDVNMQFGNGNNIGPGGRASGTTVNGPVTANAWHHICGVFRGKTDMSIYVNGASQELAYDGSGNTVAYSSASGAIGSRSYTGQTNLASGSYLDDVRIYSRALSASEVSSLASGQEYSTPAGISTTLDGDITVTGDLSINRSTLDVSASNYAVRVAGNWTNDHGVFVPRQGSVILDGVNQTVLGSNDFYDLSKSGSAADTLTFGAGDTQAISGDLTLRGVAGNYLALRSSVPGSRWRIDPRGARLLGYIDVRDSHNANSLAIAVDGRNIGDAGNNWHWDFPVSEPAGPGPGSRTAVSVPTLTPAEITAIFGKGSQLPERPVPSGSGPSAGGKSVSIGSGFFITNNADVGQTSVEIKAIQKLLNTDPATQVAKSGAGSPGKETGYYGPATKAAVQKFQIKHKIVTSSRDSGYGIVGPKTRAKMNELLRGR